MIAFIVTVYSFIACNLFAFDKVIDMNMFLMTFNTANQHKDLCDPTLNKVFLLLLLLLHLFLRRMQLSGKSSWFIKHL